MTNPQPLSGKSGKIVALFPALNDEHTKALGLDKVDAMDRPEYAEQDERILNNAVAAVAFYCAITGKEYPEEAVQLFSLGYELRRLNDKLDDGLTDEEIQDSVIKTLFTNNVPLFKRLHDEKFAEKFGLEVVDDGRE